LRYATIDLTEPSGYDPMDMIFGAQPGGGTNINKGSHENRVQLNMAPCLAR